MQRDWINASGRIVLPWMLMALLAGAIPAPAMADGVPAQGAPELADGQIVYSRDVHHAVGAPNFPGASHEATTAPTGAILGSVSNGLVPLTDLETSAVTASLPRSLALLDTGSALNGPAGALGGQAGPLIPQESASLNPGSTISNAMQSLHGALGSLKVLSGGGQ